MQSSGSPRDHASTSLTLTPTTLLLLLFAIFYLPFLYFLGWRYLHIDNADLPSFYAASVRAFTLNASPYEPEALKQLMGSPYIFPFLYPPPSLLLFYPLSLISYDAARLLVLIANHAIFLVLVWMIPLRIFRARPATHFFAAAVCVVYPILSHPVAVTISHGQVNLLLTLCLVLFWLCARRGNATAAGFFLAASILLKTYPLILLPLLLLIGRKREAVLTCAWLASATVIALAIFPATLWHEWLTQVLPSGGYLQTPLGLFSPAAPFNQSFNGFFTRTFTQTLWSPQPLLADAALGKVLAHCSALAVIIITAIAGWRSKGMPDGFDRVVLVTLPAIFLIAPLSWTHHVVYLLPSILALLLSRLQGSVATRTIFHAASIYAAIVLAVEGLLAYELSAVLLLWLLGVFAACSSKIELPLARA